MAVEEQILHRALQLIRSLSSSGVRVPVLSNVQESLASLTADMQQLQLHRHDLRQALALAWKCDPVLVRLSRVQLETPVATSVLQTQRERLQQLAHELSCSLAAAELTLRGWSGIVGIVLGELLGMTGTSDRYASNGQRVTSTRITGIDVRT